MKDKDSTRIKKVIEDKDGNLVIAIKKYRWAESLYHSGYGIVVLICIVAALVLAGAFVAVMWTAYSQQMII